LLVHHEINETGVLMTEAVVVLPPDVSGQKIIQRRDGAPPWNVARNLEPFRMLIEHRVYDVNESLVAGKKSMTPGQQITFAPALAHVLAQDFHDASVGREVLSRAQKRLHPYLVRGLIQSIEPVGRGLVGTEDPEVPGVLVQFHHVAQKRAQYPGGF